MKTFSASQNIKIALIPILGVVLYSVLPKRDATPMSVESVSDSAMSPNSVTSANEPAAKKVESIDWPIFQLEDLKGIDPMDRRLLFPELVSSEPTIDATSDGMGNGTKLISVSGPDEARNFDTIKVSAVFQSPMGVAAIVDDRVFHVGDLLPNGSSVVEITPNELVVAVQSGNSDSPMVQ